MVQDTKIHWHWHWQIKTLVIASKFPDIESFIIKSNFIISQL